MDLDFSILDWFARRTSQYLYQISFAMLATLLAIYGQDINRAVRTRIRHRHFVLRTLVFIFLCAFGYAWSLLYLSPKLAWALRHIPYRFAPAAIVLIFVFLGVLAERKRKI